MCRSPMAARGNITTCICRPASPTAAWSRSTISPNELYQRVYTGLPTPENGWLALPETPGLGFEPNPDAVREFARNA